MRATVVPKAGRLGRGVENTRVCEHELVDDALFLLYPFAGASRRRLVDARNRPQRSKDMKAAFGKTWPLQSRLATKAELDAAGIYRPYEIAGIPFPYRLEQSHAMLIGTTGTGKTVELSSLVTQIRQRNHRAVIFDLTGAFIERLVPDIDPPPTSRPAGWSNRPR